MNDERKNCPLLNKKCEGENCAFFISTYKLKENRYLPTFNCAIYVMGIVASHKLSKLKRGEVNT